MSIDEVNEFLLSGGVPAAKFDTVGTTHSGRILFMEVQQQREIDTGKPKFWEDGKPREQLYIVVQTTERDASDRDDDGRRAFYVRGLMKNAVSEALRKARAKLEIGGGLTITYTGDGERTKAGFNPPKRYTAIYAPAAQAAVDGALGEPGSHAAGASLPPGVTAEQWANLDDTERAVLAKLHDLPSF